MEKRKIDLRSIKTKIGSLKREDLEKNFRKALYSPYLYLVLGLVFGLLFTIQFKNESVRPLSPVLFYDQLKDVKNDFENKKDNLNNQVKDIQKEVKDKEKSLADKNLVSTSTLNNLSDQEMILGATSVSGEGVIITISDGANQVKDELSKSLTHAADLRDIVNLLWYAGAEAISINDERIIYNTSIDCIVSTILINNNNYVPPFTIRAIGNMRDLSGVINGSRKLVDIKKRADKKQINFDMKEDSNIKIGKYNGAFSNQ
ncbi:MAG: DUF881 domain-containing protein [Patescibacteria group bacterium]|nr:DUF881 domain-containing protein [Patescibacteria group bacterium]